MAEPLEWFFAEHFRHRQLCGMIDEVAAALAFDGARIAKIVDFLRYDLALHVIDEEEDLFPLLPALPSGGRLNVSRACSRPSATATSTPPASSGPTWNTASNSAWRHRP